MITTHSLTRGVAAVSGGTLVVGAGLAVGAGAAAMADQWSRADQQQAATLAAGPAEPDPLPPAVVTVIEERHVTPAPVIVRHRVYRDQGGGGSGTGSGSTRAAAPRSGATTRVSPQRRVVQPAPAPPRPAANRAPATTSSSS